MATGAENNSGDAVNPYPANSSNAGFSSWTTPDSRAYNGADTQVYISAIPETADTVDVCMSTAYKGIQQEFSSPVTEQRTRFNGEKFFPYNTEGRLMPPLSSL